MYVLMFSTCTGEKKIFPIVWQTTETLEFFDVEVVSITSDGGKPNRRFYQPSTINEGFSSIQKGEGEGKGAPDSQIYFL